MTLEQVKEFLQNRIYHQTLAQDEFTRITEDTDRLAYQDAYRVLSGDESYNVNERCGSCVGDMVQRVWAMYNALPQPEPIEEKENIKENKKKK